VRGSGGLARAVLDGRNPHPWQRAKFLAMGEELAAGWEPRNGVEPQLLDQLAQAHAAKFLWLDRHFFLDSTADPEATERAGALADRFNRIFLQTLRALCNLRKVPLGGVVQNAGQVNVGGQQVNVAGPCVAPGGESKGF
jgi:hypothetical protein